MKAKLWLRQPPVSAGKPLAVLAVVLLPLAAAAQAPVLVPLAIGNEWTYEGEDAGGTFTETHRVADAERRGEHEWFRVEATFQRAADSSTRVEWWRQDATGLHRTWRIADEDSDEEGDTDVVFHFPFAGGAAPAEAVAPWTEIVTLNSAAEIEAALGLPAAGRFERAVCYGDVGQDGLGLGYCFAPGVGLIFEMGGAPVVLVRYHLAD